ARTRAIDETKIDIVVEEELGDGSGGACFDFGLQHVDIGLNAGRLRMLLRIAGDRDFEGRDLLYPYGEVGGVAVAVRRRRVAIADPAGRIAAQRHDVAHTQIPIIADYLIEFGFGRRNAGEMRCRFQRRLAQDTRDCRVRALAGRAPCAISDGDIAWTEGLEAADRAPQRLLHGRGLRWEELEGYVDRAAAKKAALMFGGCKHHAATSTLVPTFFFVAATGFRPSQSDTVSLP